MTNDTCVVEDCEKLRGGSRGWCEMHRARMRRHGTLEPGPTAHAPAEVRFWRRVDKTDDCWLWTGGSNGLGYGVFGIATGQTMGAHRYSWQIVFGPIPDGMFVCHQCDTPACVRPDHLFLGTHEDNMVDMVSKGRQAYVNCCAAGHPWTEDSTRHVMVNGRQTRRCRLCRREQDGSTPAGAAHCQACGRELGPPPYKGHPRKYCDAECRAAFYRIDATKEVAA